MSGFYSLRSFGWSIDGMTRRGRARSRTVVAVVAALALTAPLAILGLVLRQKGLNTAANVGQLVGVGLAVPALAMPLWLWWRHDAGPVPVLAAGRLQSAKNAL